MRAIHTERVLQTLAFFVIASFIVGMSLYTKKVSNENKEICKITFFERDKYGEFLPYTVSASSMLQPLLILTIFEGIWIYIILFCLHQKSEDTRLFGIMAGFTAISFVAVTSGATVACFYYPELTKCFMSNSELKNYVYMAYGLHMIAAFVAVLGSIWGACLLVKKIPQFYTKNVDDIELRSNKSFVRFA